MLSLSNNPPESDCLIIKKSGEIGLKEALATLRQLMETVPIPGRKRNYKFNKNHEKDIATIFPEFHALPEQLYVLIGACKSTDLLKTW